MLDILESSRNELSDTEYKKLSEKIIGEIAESEDNKFEQYEINRVFRSARGAGNGYAPQVAAAGECQVSDARHTVGNGDARQTVAAAESQFPDTRHAVGNNDLGLAGLRYVFFQNSVFDLKAHNSSPILCIAASDLTTSHLSARQA